MPIEFTCECGKAYKVADQYAGKRSKCTACGKPVLVPTPAPTPAAEESAEDAALRALLDGPDEEPSAPGRYAGRAELPPPPPPRPVPSSARDTASDMLARTAEVPKPSKAKKQKAPAYHSSYDAPRERRWSPNWAKVGGGILGVLGGSALLFGGLAFGRFFIWSPIIILVGLFGIINGLLSKS